MDNTIEQQSESSLFGPISLIAVFSNFLLIVVGTLLNRSGYISGYLLNESIWLAFLLTLLIGIVSGIVAFIYTKAWAGLALNFFLLVLIGIGVLTYFYLLPLPHR